MFHRLAAAAAVLTILSSCVTARHVALSYEQGQPGWPGPAEFTVAAFADRRGMMEKEVGSTRADLTSPLEVLTTSQPVSVQVANAVGFALQARGMLVAAPAARYAIGGEILEMQCRQMLRPTATVLLRLSVYEMSSGRVLGSVLRSSKKEGEMLPAGVGASVAHMSHLLSSALQEAIDLALDDGELRGRIPSGSMSASPPPVVPVSYQSPAPALDPGLPAAPPQSGAVPAPGSVGPAPGSVGPAPGSVGPAPGSVGPAPGSVGPAPGSVGAP